MKLEEFVEQFIENTRNDSVLSNSTPDVQFLELMISHLESMEYLVDPLITGFYKELPNKSVVKIDGFAYDDSDKSLVLIVNDYIDDTTPHLLSQPDFDNLCKKMLNFLKMVSNESYKQYMDESQFLLKYANQMNRRLRSDFYNLDNDISVDKVKLYIITNKILSKRVSNLKWNNFEDKQVEINVWDIQRIFDIYKTGRDKEPIIIDITKHNFGEGIDYLKANFGHDIDYESYLCVLPGKLLSDIYWEHGSRLLEGNVRAFLSARGNVNKGIRNTILKTPDKFFTYNNGIACTAKQIKLSADSKKIIEIEDLQIINGGQTTVSLTNAWKKDKATLENIFVPMKLTIIYSNDYEDMVSKISRYANSQNKVTDADFFSNHPFHQAMESISKGLFAPPKAGAFHSTIWYYERSRGKYMQEQFKLSKKSELDAFAKKYPKNQVLAKEDFAKYVVAGEFKRPDIVSRGRQKNMKFFGEFVENSWDKNKNIYNEQYFKNSVCFAIIYKTIDNIVKNASWYNVGGIKLNIVPYTLAKIIDSIPKNYSLDFEKIWRLQDVYPSLRIEIDKVAQLANDFINDSNNVIVTEYAKKEDTWNRFKDIKIKFSDAFLDDLVNIILVQEKLDSAKKKAMENEKIIVDIEVVNLARTENGKYWERLLIEGEKFHLLTGKEVDIIKKYICELSKPNPKYFPSTAQCKIAWEARKKLGENGIII